MTPPRAFYVYHGGQLYGQGRWSGPHATRAEAQKSCGECTRVTGAHAFVECEPLPVDATKAPAANDVPPSQADADTGPASYYHGPTARRYSGD
jgi:hypothetical protein